MTVIGAAAPTRVEDVVSLVRGHGRVVPHGARTKAPLIADGGAAIRIDTSGLSGVIEYDPAEYTFTARAGTPLAQIEALLAGNGQVLPFDPPFIAAGATLGGTVAAGLNGSGRLRYGGVRDFVIGVCFVDGTGRVVRGGGRVVKNAAGFDLPKLMVGSMGRLGVLVDLTFKVFPAPRARLTFRVACHDLADAVDRLIVLTRTPLEPEAADLEPPSSLVVRVAGDPASLDAHASRVADALGRPCEFVESEAAESYWRRQNAFEWVGSALLVKVPLTVRRIAELDAFAARHDVSRRYSVAGNVAWVAWPADRALESFLDAGFAGLVVRGALPAGASPWVGPADGASAPFAARVKHALDPSDRFPPLA